MTSVDRVLAALTDRGCDHRRNGNGWSAQCPAHDDRNPSLSIDEGDDGRALVRCHAGCSAEEIIASLGMTMRDLMPEDQGSSRKSRSKTAKSKASSPHRNEQPEPRTYATAKDAVAELESRHGERSAAWAYHDATGEAVGAVIRWDRPDGKKDIRPVSRDADGRWFIGGMPEPRPLYALPEILAANPWTTIYVVEGEKAADAGRSISRTTTTSPHGSKSAAKADWSPLAGREVTILPDNDDAGREYAEAVVSILANLKPCPNVKVVELPGLPKGGDLADWVDQRRDDLSRAIGEVQNLSDQAERLDLAAVATPSKGKSKEDDDPKPPPYMPFPTDVLPSPIREFIEAGSRALGCDESYVALPLLWSLAAAVGNARRVQLKSSWCEPCVLWIVIVGASGTMKSPALDLSLHFVQERQNEAFTEYEKAREKYDQDILIHEKDVQIWKSKKS